MSDYTDFDYLMSKIELQKSANRKDVEKMEHSVKVSIESANEDLDMNPFL